MKTQTDELRKLADVLDARAMLLKEITPSRLVVIVPSGRQAEIDPWRGRGVEVSIDLYAGMIPFGILEGLAPEYPSE